MATFRVETIVDEKTENGENFYLIKWAGYPDSSNTWEPAKNIIDEELIELFHQSKKSSLSRTPSKRSGSGLAKTPSSSKKQKQSEAAPADVDEKSPQSPAVKKRTRSASGRTPAKSPSRKTPRKREPEAPKELPSRTRNSAKSPQAAAPAAESPLRRRSSSLRSRTPIKGAQKKAVAPQAMNSPASQPSEVAEKPIRRSPSNVGKLGEVKEDEKKASTESTTTTTFVSSQFLSRSSFESSSRNLGRRTVRKKGGFTAEGFLPYALFLTWVLSVVHFVAIFSSFPALLQWASQQDALHLFSYSALPPLAFASLTALVTLLACYVVRMWSREAHSSPKAADHHARYVCRAAHSVAQLLAYSTTEFFQGPSSEYEKNALAVALGYNIQDLFLHGLSEPNPARSLALVLDAVATFTALLNVGDVAWCQAMFIAIVLRATVELLRSVRQLLPLSSRVGQTSQIVALLLSSGGVFVLGSLVYLQNNSFTVAAGLAFYLMISTILGIIEQGGGKRPSA